MSEDFAAKEAKDWHSSKQIGKRARHLLEHPDEQIPSDVTFLVGDGKDEPQKTFKCHKFILAMVSSMFQAMFYGSFPQTDDLIKIPDVTPAAFQLMLRYAYGEHMQLDYTASFMSLEDVMDTVYCPKKYLIGKLARACRDYIQFQVIILKEDSCVVLQKAPQMDEADLDTLALAMIAQYPYVTLNGEVFPRLSFDCVKRIVDSPHLKAPERFIYLGVRRWVEHNVGAVTGGALRDAFGSLLYSIRFPLFSVQQLADGPLTDDVLTGAEVSSLLSFLFGKVKPAVPFLSAPRTPLPAPWIYQFDVITAAGQAICPTFSSGMCTTFLDACPDLAPECCAFLEQLVANKLHIRIGCFDNEHLGKTVPLPAAVQAESRILSYSVKGACCLNGTSRRASLVMCALESVRNHINITAPSSVSFWSLSVTDTVRCHSVRGMTSAFSVLPASDEVKRS